MINSRISRCAGLVQDSIEERVQLLFRNRAMSIGEQIPERALDILQLEGQLKFVFHLKQSRVTHLDIKGLVIRGNVAS